MTIRTTGLGPAGPGALLLRVAARPGHQQDAAARTGRRGRQGDVRGGLELVGSYHAVDVSLQADNGNPGHSDTSVLRAQY